MKIGFTTLGCPGWDLDTICARASEYGFDGVDFRGLLDTLDITLLSAFTGKSQDAPRQTDGRNGRREFGGSRPQEAFSLEEAPQQAAGFFTPGIAETKRKLDDAGLEVCGISSSIQICAPEKRNDNIKEAQRTVAVAQALGCQNIRVFGGGNPQAIGREKAADLGQECMEAILEIDGARDLNWLFETHDYWIASHHCQLLLERIPVVVRFEKPAQVSGPVDL